MNCPQCGVKMDHDQKNAIQMMSLALSMTEKIKDSPVGFMPKVVTMTESIYEEAGVDLPTLNELSKKGWCLKCITKEYKARKEGKNNESLP